MLPAEQLLPGLHSCCAFTSWSSWIKESLPGAGGEGWGLLLPRNELVPLNPLYSNTVLGASSPPFCCSRVCVWRQPLPVLSRRNCSDFRGGSDLWKEL